MNDPFRTSLLDDNLDPFDRATLWDHWGFRLLDMPYVQPPLSDTQDAVDSLILIAKPLLPPFDAWPAETVRALIRDYLIYAMRFANPEASPHFTAMADWLAQRAQVALRPLAASVGRDPVIPWIDVRDRRDPAFAAAMRLNHAPFASDIALDAEGFAAFLDARSNPNLRYAYHLWVVPDPVGDEVQAFASFFSLAHCGFGGYVRRRRLPRHPPDVSVAVAIASVEERMRRDNPAIEGWFIECDPQDAKHPASLFYRHGFREVAVAYRQPPLPGKPHEFGKAKVLTLLYKPLGGRSRMPVLTTGLFLSAMEDMFRVVYGMPQPARSAYHAHLRSQLSADSTALVPFNAEAPTRRRA